MWNSSTDLKGIEQDTRKAKKKLVGMVLVKTPNPHNDLALVEERTSSGTALESCNIDYEKLNQVLDILSTFDPRKLSVLMPVPVQNLSSAMRGQKECEGKKELCFSACSMNRRRG